MYANAHLLAFYEVLVAILIFLCGGSSEDTVFCSTHDQVLDKPDEKWCHRCFCKDGLLKCRGDRLCPSLRYFEPPTQSALKSSGDLRFYEKQLMTLRVNGIEKCDRRLQSLAP